MQYEITYLVGEKNEGKLESIKKDIDSMLKKEQAEILEAELVNKRKLSYEVNHEIKGIYVTKRFDLPEIDYWDDEYEAGREKINSINSLTKKMNLNNDILRFIIVKTDELPDLLKKKDVRKPETRKTGTPKTEKRVMPEKKEEEKKAEESIDKKLEEILNI